MEPDQDSVRGQALPWIYVSGGEKLPNEKVSQGEDLQALTLAGRLFWFLAGIVQFVKALLP